MVVGRPFIVNMVSDRYHPSMNRSGNSSPAEAGTDAARELAELALQLGRATYGEYPADGLTPAQWTALRFFASANRFSRTVSAFADFHATTRGTASQTVKSLVERGLLRRTRSERDGRSVRFDLSAAARRQLRRDPFHSVVRAAASLPDGQRLHALEVLKSMLGQVAEDRQRPLPGRCSLCGHLQEEGTGAYRCRLLQEPLERREVEEICVRFSART